MDHAAQKGPGGQDQRAAGDLLTRGGRDSFDAAIFQENIGGLGFDHAEMFNVRNRRLHGLAVELAVGLCSRAAHGRAFGAVEDAELDAGLVRNPSHKPVERIDFADKMAFAKPADGRIAGHCADRCKGQRDEGGLCAHPRGRRRRLAAGMAAADHDHIKSHGH